MDGPWNDLQLSQAVSTNKPVPEVAVIWTVPLAMPRRGAHVDSYSPPRSRRPCQHPFRGVNFYGVILTGVTIVDELESDASIDVALPSLDWGSHVQKNVPTPLPLRPDFNLCRRVVLRQGAPCCSPGAVQITRSTVPARMVAANGHFSS